MNIFYIQCVEKVISADVWATLINLKNNNHDLALLM